MDIALPGYGLSALQACRLEGACIVAGWDCSTEVDPQPGFERSPFELGLGWLVNLEAGDFIGRDAFLNYDSPREKYATFSVDAGNCAIWGDEAIFLDGEAIGYVTSGGFGPACEKHIALGYVNCDAYRPGGQYSVEILGQLQPAELQTEPLYDPSGSKMRA